MASVVYVGDFDIRNENAQAHLVLNNGKIIRKLGYSTSYIGTNRTCFSFSDIKDLEKIKSEEYDYYELPHTLTVKGLTQIKTVSEYVIDALNQIENIQGIKYVISYQSPSYAVVLSDIIKWCKTHSVPYIVNCADITVFDGQPLVRRLVMKLNWHYLHKITYTNAAGVIAVSDYIKKFYYREGRPSVVIPPLFDSSTKVGFPKKENDLVTFVYAGTPFPLQKRQINPAGMKDRLDLIVALFMELEKQGMRFIFEVVGVTKEEYCFAVPQHEKQLSLSSQIRFYGKKSHDHTLSIVSQADYMINYRDCNIMTQAGLSTKVVESVSLGTPVVMNNIGDTFRYLQEGVTGFMLTNDMSNNVELVRDLALMSVEKRANIKRACQENKVFSIDAYVDKFKTFFEQLSD